LRTRISLAMLLLLMMMMIVMMRCGRVFRR